MFLVHVGLEGPPDRVESPFSFPEGSGERLVGPLPGERGGAWGALITRTHERLLLRVSLVPSLQEAGLKLQLFSSHLRQDSKRTL